MKKILTLLIGLFFWVSVYAQQDSTLWKPTLNVGLRSYFMRTSYWEDYKNDYAWGQMARIAFTSKLPHHFQVQAEYLGFLNILSSDLSVFDSRVSNLNRYEVGLFDVNHLDKTVFGKIGNLHLDYLRDNFQASLGRMEINSPFINAQDGRLSPTYVEGLNWNLRVNPRISFAQHLITGISPRSTGNWFDLGESIGMYPVGRDENGQGSDYSGNTRSDFINILDLKFRLNSASSLILNHTLVNNIYSAYLAQWDKNWELPSSSFQWITGFQTTIQHGIGNGGNEDIALRYKNPEDFHWILSGRIGIKSEKSLWHINYTKMQGEGRYLSPREWGKDPFYTFIPRERNEGLGQVDALSTYFQHAFPKKSLQLYSYMGVYFLPDPADATKNKYAMPSYAQANLGLRYNPKKWMEGLNLHLILMGKTALNQQDLRPAWVYNKVNLFHTNLILNYTFPSN
tara:strand:- start:57 stop:1418 length:1362 start_codon:yes stop_codon:yes gene_type:complete